MKALVVDDELTTRMVLQEMLAPYAEVHCCVDGSEAVLAHRRALEDANPYDLICIDILMPVMNGLEALKLIRKEEESRGRTPPHVAKVIITTATGDIATIRQAFRELCDAYIVKPIDAEELIGLLHCLFPIGESMAPASLSFADSPRNQRSRRQE